MTNQRDNADSSVKVKPLAVHEGAAIEGRKLTASFGAHRVLDEVDLEIAKGQTVAVVGANGAGKTTLLRCLAGVLRPTSGEVLWFGEPSRNSPAARWLVGMVAHQRLVYPELTPRENLMFAARMYDVREPAQLADALQRLQRDEALRTRQGANARRLAEDVFARDRLAGRFCDLLEHLSGTPRNANRSLPDALREPLVPAVAPSQEPVRR